MSSLYVMYWVSILKNSGEFQSFGVILKKLYFFWLQKNKIDSISNSISCIFFSVFTDVGSGSSSRVKGISPNAHSQFLFLHLRHYNIEDNDLAVSQVDFTVF